jgi:hypothetical protein
MLAVASHGAAPADGGAPRVSFTILIVDYNAFIRPFGPELGTKKTH